MLDLAALHRGSQTLDRVNGYSFVRNIEGILHYPNAYPQ